MLTKEEIQSGLCQFTQINGWYDHWLNQFVFTDGVKWLCDCGDCSWLLDDIASYQFQIRGQYPQLEPFQIWQLHQLPDGSNVLECKGDRTTAPIIRQELESSHPAMVNITLWLVNGMLLLPNEYTRTMLAIA